MRRRYSFEADWRPYAFPEDESHLTSEEELKEHYSTYPLAPESHLPAAGIPILSDGLNITVDPENTMNIIFGTTGSKKTRVLAAPFICACASAGESMIIPDIKGELSQGALSPYIRGVLRKNGYKVRVINFRDFDCDGYNILLEPYRLYRSGHKDDAMTEINKIVSSLVGIRPSFTADPFWEKTASQYLMAVIVLLFEFCDDPSKINMLSLASYTSEESCEYICRAVNQIQAANNIMTMLRSVLSEPEKTRMSTLATANSYLTDYIVNEKLLKMLSESTFSLEELYLEKTALFIIMPDETDAFKDITGLLLSQISSFLVRAAYQLGGTLPRRVNYICDEFCQYYIPGMAVNIAAHRSRNIRWTMVCQSRRQLEMTYRDDAATILANCTNTFFLSSPETELLEELSLRAGFTNKTPDGNPRRLISVAALRKMKKEWEYTDVYFSSGPFVCVTRLPDISRYELVRGFTVPGSLERHTFSRPKAYSAEELLADCTRYRNAFDLERQGGRRITAADRKAAAKYKKLFSGS